MIDFHNHILPGCDDGAKTIEESIDMLKCAQEQGITDVVNTIHFQHPKMEGKRTDFEYVSAVKDKLQDKLIEHGIDVKLHLGAEVFFNFNLLDILNNKLITFCNMKYMLIEFHTLSFPKNFNNHLYELALSGVTPIIAHPERYKPIQNDISIAEELINSGCLMQVDGGSFLGQFGEKCKNISEIMLRRRMVHIIGSDAHNNKKRNFCLKPAFEVAQNTLGDDASMLVKENPQKVINGENIEILEIKNESKEKTSIYKKIIKKLW